MYATDLTFAYGLVGLLLWAAAALMTTYAATQKGYSGGAFLVLGALVPVLSLIFAAALPLSWEDREKERRALAKDLASLLYEDVEE